MIKFFSIDAVHPVLRRVIKLNLSTTEADVLHKELLDAGYEENNIDLKPTLIIMESDDKIELSTEFIDHITNDLENSEFKKDRDLFNVKRIFNYIFNDNIPPVITGTLRKVRIGREGNGHMCVRWNNVSEDHGVWKETDVGFLKAIGYKFAPVKFDPIPILQCDDDMLSDYDRVIKYLMIDNDLSEKDALTYMEKVNKAMNKADCIIYQP